MIKDTGVGEIHISVIMSHNSPTFAIFYMNQFFIRKLRCYVVVNLCEKGKQEIIRKETSEAF
jgi:hypothetical protein